MSHYGTFHVPWWDTGGTGRKCVHGTGLMRRDRDETSVRTETMSSDLQFFNKDLHVMLVSLNLEIACPAIEPGHLESPQI